MIQFEKYICWQCKFCGRWQGHFNQKYHMGLSELEKQVMISRVNLTCLRCRKRFKLKKKTTYGLNVNYMWIDHPKKMTETVQRLNGKGDYKQNSSVGPDSS
jgi:hypothetical protein